MSMIPSAQTLADLLNDPAIPAEAKPNRHMSIDPRAGLPGGGHETSPYPANEYEVNAALFWSMSAFLWEQGASIFVSPLDPLYQACCTHNDDGLVHTTRVVDESPAESLAAVVREVAKGGA